jgi:hypothetical protein
MSLAICDKASAPKVLGRMPAPSSATFLPAGHAFNQHEKRAVIAAAREAERIARSTETAERAARERQHAALLEKNDKSHYGILGLTHLGIEATVDDINKAYRDLLGMWDFGFVFV